MPDSWKDLVNLTDWVELEHAYGGAEDVPAILEALTGEDADEAASELWASVLHQGSIYDATAPAMVALAAMTATGAADDDLAGWLLMAFAEAVNSLATYAGDPEDVALLASCRAAQTQIADLLLPTVASSVTAALAQTARADPSDEVLAALTAGAVTNSSNETAWACISALVALGADGPDVDIVSPLVGDDLARQLAAALKRIERDRASETDIDLLISHWELAVEVMSSIIPFDGSFGVWLSQVNPGVATRALADLPEPDAGTVEALVALVLNSRSAGIQATSQLLRLSYAPTADPVVLIAALRQLPPSPAVCDALYSAAERITDRRPHVMNHKVETDPRADAALALFQAGDGRWYKLLTVVLISNPAAGSLFVMASSHCTMALGRAFVEAPIPTGAGLGIRSVLEASHRERATVGDGAIDNVKTSAIVAILGWLARQPTAVDGIVDVLVDLLSDFPDAAAKVLAAWGQTDAVPLIRNVASGPGALLAIAQLTADPQDLAATLASDMTCHESELFDSWADHRDPVFLEWCRQLAGEEPRYSNPERADQIRAVTALVDAEPTTAVRWWTYVLTIVDGGRGPLTEAITMLVDWIDAGLVPEAQAAELGAVLDDLVVNGRASANRDRPQTRVDALRGLLRLRGPWSGDPDLPVSVIRRAFADDWAWQSVWPVLEALADSPQLVRDSVVACLQGILSQDQRLDSTDDQAIADEVAVAKLRQVVDVLSS